MLKAEAGSAGTLSPGVVLYPERGSIWRGSMDPGSESLPRRLAPAFWPWVLERLDLFLHGCPRATALFSLPEALTVLPHSASRSPAAPPTGLPRPCLWVWETGWCLGQNAAALRTPSTAGWVELLAQRFCALLVHTRAFRNVSIPREMLAAPCGWPTFDLQLLVFLQIFMLLSAWKCLEGSDWLWVS